MIEPLTSPFTDSTSAYKSVCSALQRVTPLSVNLRIKVDPASFDNEGRCLGTDAGRPETTLKAQPSLRSSSGLGQLHSELYDALDMMFGAMHSPDGLLPRAVHVRAVVNPQDRYEAVLLVKPVQDAVRAAAGAEAASQVAA